MVTAERVCAWCETSMGTVEGDFDPSHRVTHGICADCGCVLLRARERVSAQEFLDRLGVPVLLVDAEGRALAAGQRAREVLGKEFPSLEGFKGGAFVDCVNARSDEGCGGAVLCRSRAITRSVIETYETGKACIGVPAYPDAEGGAAALAPTLRITTEKVGDLVVLRVDE